MKIQELLQNQNIHRKSFGKFDMLFLDISRKIYGFFGSDIEESVISKITQAYDDFVVQKNL